MLIHFISSKTDLEKEIDRLRIIMKVIKDGGHTLTRDWIEEAYERSKNNERFEDLDWDTIYNDNMEALARADLVIADATHKSFAVGFQTAVALQHKKPTLLLQREGAAESGYYPASTKNNLFTHRVYDDKNLAELVQEFIKDNVIDNKDLRFNFFIDRQIYNYLRWAAYKTGKTKAEILRELVQHEIEKQED